MSKVDMGLVVWDIEEGQIGESRPSDGALEATAPSLQSNQQKQGFVVGEVREHLLDCLLQVI